jgi:hypothetical protein
MHIRRGRDKLNYRNKLDIHGRDGFLAWVVIRPFGLSIAVNAPDPYAIAEGLTENENADYIMCNAIKKCVEVACRFKRKGNFPADFSIRMNREYASFVPANNYIEIDFVGDFGYSGY